MHHGVTMHIDKKLTGDEPVSSDYVFTPVHDQVLCDECNDKDVIINELRKRLHMYEQAEESVRMRILAQLGHVTVSGIY